MVFPVVEDDITGKGVPDIFSLMRHIGVPHIHQWSGQHGYHVLPRLMTDREPLWDVIQLSRSDLNTQW